MAADRAGDYDDGNNGAINTTCKTMQKQGGQAAAAAPAHVVVMPYPAQGHINPMMHLSKQLAAHGVVITFVNTQFNHDRLLQSQATAGILLPHQHDSTDTNEKLDIRLVGIPDGLGYEDYIINFSVVKQCQGLIDMEPLLMKLIEAQQDPPVTCIIADIFAICTPTIAKRFGIPHVAFWTQNAACYAAHSVFTQNYASLRGQFYPEVMHGEADESMKTTAIPGCPPLKLREVPTFLQPLDPSDFVFKYLIQNFKDVLDSAYVLLNTFEELEQHSLASITKPPMLVMGPVLPPDFVFSRNGLTDVKGEEMSTVSEDNQSGSWKEATKNMKKLMKLGTSMWTEDEEGCMPWLDQQKTNSVLYVSFGSITNMSPEQIHEFANGLEASGWPFLMVARPELTSGVTHTATFLRAFVERMSSSGRAAFVEWAPQLDVLAHPAVGGFLTHCGWNSTLESICMGVPMLCWPYFADQMLDCRCIVDAWKVGLDFVAEQMEEEENGIITEDNKNNDSIRRLPLVTCHEIERKVKQIMDPSLSQEIRERANHLSRTAKQAFKGSSRSSFMTLLYFLLS